MKKIISLALSLSMSNSLSMSSCSREEAETRQSFLEIPIETIDQSGLRITIFKGTKDNPRIYRVGDESNAVHYVEEEDFFSRNNFILPKGYTFDPRENAVYFN